MPRCPAHAEVELEVKLKGWRCPLCDDVVLTYDDAPRLAAPPRVVAVPAAPDTSDLDGVPFPVAHPLHFARDASLDASRRLDNVIFTAYQAMRVTGLLLLADYLSCDTVTPRLASAIRGLRTPHWGEWSVLCSQLARLWAGNFPDARPDRPPFFPSLGEGWMEVSRPDAAKRDPWAGALAGLAGLSGRAANANDALQKLRNDRAHRMATRGGDDGADAAALARFLPLVERMVSTLFPGVPFVLFRRVGAPGAGTRAIRLHGAHPDLSFEAETLDPGWRATFAEAELVALVAGAAVPVYPLLIPGDARIAACGPAGGGLVEPVTMVDGIREKRIVVLGARSSGESTEHVGPVLAVLAEKRVDMALERRDTTRWTLAGWSRLTAREALAELRGRKYFPECHVERAGVDDVVATCLTRSGRALLLLGEAGSGKSSLLARVADRLSADAEGAAASHGEEGAGEDVVLFLSGRAAYSGDAGAPGPKLLCDAVLRTAGVRAGEFRDLADFAAHLARISGQDTVTRRRVVLILDALNEADRFTDLLKAVDAFLPAVATHPWLRLLLSMRAGAYHALARRSLDAAAHAPGVLENERHLVAFASATGGREVPYLDMRPFDAAEGRAAYERRQAAAPGRSASTPYDRLAPPLRDLLRSPLHLHVFHETYAGGREAPATLGEADLLDAYLEALCERLPALHEILGRIGALMYERRDPSLPLATADEWLAAWRASQAGDSATRTARLDPIEELVAASLLLRPAEEGFGVNRALVAFQFSHQKLCEQVLLRELRRRAEIPTESDLLAWARHAAGPEQGEHDDFVELVGALEVVAARLVTDGRGEILAALLDLDDEPARTRILGAGLRALGPAWAAGAQAALGLARIVERASATGERGRRFKASSRAASRWLEEAGHSIPAEAIERGRLGVVRQLVQAEPRRADLQRDLSVSLNNLGRLARAAGRSDEARRFFQESLDLMRQLLQAGPTARISSATSPSP